MRLVFIGTGEIGVPVLRSLLDSPEHELVGVVTQPDKPVGRAQLVEPTPIKAALAEVNLPLLQPDRIKQEEAVAKIRELAPDVIVVMAYGQIVPPSVLDDSPGRLPKSARVASASSPRRSADPGSHSGRRSTDRDHRDVHG